MFLEGTQFLKKWKLRGIAALEINSEKKICWRRKVNNKFKGSFIDKKAWQLQDWRDKRKESEY